MARDGLQGMVSVGLFGKLPAFGDFLQRELPGEFVNALDGWLQRVIVGSRQQLGDDWLPAYLSGPIWRFALSEDIAGATPWCGILMPSVDRVGRYFPLCIAGQWLRGSSTFHLAVGADAWLDQLEAIALEALDASYLEMDALMARVRALPAPGAAPRRVVETSGWQAAACWPDLQSTWIDRLESQATAELTPVSLWWTAGSEGAPAQWKAVRAWPDAAGFAQMLGVATAQDQANVQDQANAQGAIAPDQARQQGHDLQPAQAAGAGTSAMAAALPRSAGLTGAGHIRSSNQDAWLDRGDVGCWAVADGMGGHEDGERASRAVVDALTSQLRATASLMALSVTVRSAIEAANQTLREGVDVDADCLAGSTVVALALSGAQACALWVGDSRLYLWRAGAVVQVTDDHVGTDGSPSHEITRAVGGAASVDVDEKRFAVQPGDRLLLCSDGVHGVLPREALATLMGVGTEPLEMAQAIERAVLAGKAPDNYTAVAVFV